MPIKMTKTQKAYYILTELEKLYPNAGTELSNWETDFQFLVCIMLSAQTTDIQVNKVTEKLFKKFTTPHDFASLEPEELMKEVRSINFYKTKSKHIVQTARLIDERYDGRVPKKVEELMELPGVGYKTANVFLNDYYKANQGIAVDTHVSRVAQRLGLTKHKDPTKIAKTLERIYKKDDWYKINQLFVLYGRYVCKAKVKPEESECIFKDFCEHCGG